MSLIRPSYRLRVFAPRSIDPDEATILSPAAGAEHSDPFMVTTASGLLVPATTAPLVGPVSPWPNEPANYLPLSDYGFEDMPLAVDDAELGTSGWRITDGSSLTTMGPVSVAGAPYSGPMVWRWHFDPAVALSGSSPGTLYRSTGTPRTKLYCAYYFKISSPFPKHTTPHLHMFFGFPTSGGDMMSSYNFDAGSGNWEMVWEDMANGRSTNTNAPGTVVTEGGWHFAESLWEYPNIAKGWVDGVLHLNYTDVPYPTDAGFTEIQFSPTWGGYPFGDYPAFDGYLWLDHAHVSYGV